MMLGRGLVLCAGHVGVAQEFRHPFEMCVGSWFKESEHNHFRLMASPILCDWGRKYYIYLQFGGRVWKIPQFLAPIKDRMLALSA